MSFEQTLPKHLPLGDMALLIQDLGVRLDELWQLYEQIQEAGIAERREPKKEPRKAGYARALDQAEKHIEDAIDAMERLIGICPATNAADALAQMVQIAHFCSGVIEYGDGPAMHRECRRAHRMAVSVIQVLEKLNDGDRTYVAGNQSDSGPNEFAELFDPDTR